MLSPLLGKARLREIQRRSFERPLTPAETKHAATVAHSLQRQGVDLKATGLTPHLLGITEPQQAAARLRRYDRPAFIQPTAIDRGWRRKTKRRA